jgi:hypothetical protein
MIDLENWLNVNSRTLSTCISEQKYNVYATPLPSQAGKSAAIVCVLCPLRRFFDLVLKLFWQCGIFCFYFIILLESRTLSTCISEKRSNRRTRHFLLKWLFRCRERESLCICMLRVSILPLSTIFRLYFGTISTVWDFLCFIYFIFFRWGGSFKELLSNFLHCISACK